MTCVVQTWAQHTTPGGVDGTFLWYVAKEINGQAVYIRVKDSSVIYPTSLQGAGLLNYRPAVVFDGSSQAVFNLGTHKLSEISCFIAYQPTNVSSENIIWHTERNGETDIVLTTSRMADLGQRHYSNFIDLFPLYPKVTTYIQKLLATDRDTSSNELVVAGRPLSPQLPITGFFGSVPEVLLYDRILDADEQVRVASYMALKYGITLAEPGASYQLSSGERVWDGASYSAYHHNIAGLARDDRSGLLQKKAASSNTAGLLAFSTTDSLFDQACFLWGDNNELLMNDTRKAGQPLLLKRKWLAVEHGLRDSFSASVFLDAKQLDVPLPPHAIYWLAIDHAGKGEFDPATTEYVPMNGFDAKGQASFSNISWMPNSDGRLSFSFAIGGPLLASVAQVQPTCNQPATGRLDIKLWGGRAPYQVAVFAEQRPVYVQETNQRQVAVPSLAPGYYRLKITDRDGNVYADSIYLNNSDGPRPISLDAEYSLSPGEQRTLDASEQMEANLAYEWTGPNDFHSISPHVTLTAEGRYTIRVSRNGCSYAQDILVNRLLPGPFKTINVYPNPSSGQFTIALALHKPSAVSMSIYTDDGRLVLRRQLSGFTYYNFTEQLNATGAYYIEFSVGRDKSTTKLLITK